MNALHRTALARMSFSFRTSMHPDSTERRVQVEEANRKNKHYKVTAFRLHCFDPRKSQAQFRGVVWIILVPGTSLKI